MARKKEAKYYELIDNTIVMQEEDIVNLTEEDKKMISFYHNVLGYQMCFVKPEEKKKNYFRIENAIKYIKKVDKAALDEFNAFRVEADKLAKKYKEMKAAAAGKKENAPKAAELKAAQKEMITAQREAFNAQKEWFKNTYGKEAYDQVRFM